MQVAWLFPGQGSQVVGMGRDVLEAFPAARAVFEKADAALGPDSHPISKVILEGPEDALTLTANAQPAIVTTSSAILAALSPGASFSAVRKDASASAILSAR